MNMKQVFESAMNGSFDLTDMLGKINTHHICGNLTDEDRDVLIATARAKADPMGGLDVVAKLEEFERRLRVLEDAHKSADGEDDGTGDDGATGDDGTGDDDAAEDAAAEYVAGKWYYAGDRISFDGVVYACIAPEGVVCVWSPAEYPTYWELV